MGRINSGDGVEHTTPNGAANGVGAKRPVVDGQRDGFMGLWQGQKSTVIVFVLTVLFLIHYIARPLLPPTATELATQKPSNLHVVIPASKADPNLCKVLLSAAILGYPSPAIINWQKDFSDGSLVEGGSHLAKISGVYEYLASFDETHEDDLVLMVDGFDIWFQLRPQTLIDRYFDVNRRADQRIRNELGPAAEKYGIRQEIIFGCQKRCWPWTFDDPPCYAVPESNLPKDIYGPETDTDVGNEENPYIKYRQRFLNSGVGMGTLRAMRKMFGQALAQAEKERNFGSDQFIFSHIFGDQQVWREVLRRDSMSARQKMQHKWRGPPANRNYNEKHLTEVVEKAKTREDGNFEFGIGVDYESKIGLNTVFAEDDTEWVHFNDEAQLRDVQASRSIDPTTGHLQGIEADIDASLPPFWTFSYEKDLPRWTSWRNVSLFTDVWTGVTPAIIHHNAHRNGLKSLRETWWPNIWFQNHSRTLLDAHIYAPVVPIAYSGYDNATAREFWPYDIWKGGARNGYAALGSSGGDNWIKFDDVCEAYHEEIWRDGKGAWVLPLVH
ncbi:uncharacterized protein LTR77_001305 [Saxophila tyrrhenica]|uniref:Uncharacterized protein n=1 Tax=Saxophila tyrrhenica TaxID=1690608 RepID=A0AAV9PKF1_9PEZI|nr:hypothetical protein LTR77_001305 [Saxophila tyrrhenica]